jgi:hypothetical protein
MAPIIIQGRIWATVLAVVLTASSAVPTSAEVIFASNINNNGEREIVSFQPPNHISWHIRRLMPFPG